MKKILLSSMTAVILITATACGRSSNENDSNTTTSAVTTTAITTTAVTTATPPIVTEPPLPGMPTLDEAKTYLRANFENFNIDGSSSMIPLHTSLNKLFVEEESFVSHSKTVDAFDKLLNDENDILLSVDFSAELMDYAKKSGVELEKRAITREAFVFLINKNNPVQNLTTEQIKGIYSGKITNWKQVGGDDAPINAFQRNSDSGSQIRMEMFMGDTPLTKSDVKYINAMGAVVEEIANFDSGKYSIAYNMYTFTEKQYYHEDVTLLAVDGMKPTDDTVFNDSYPIVIYNYIWHNKNNSKATEFADNLYVFLMSEEGQKLTADSGYVNLNKQFDRNMNGTEFWDSDNYTHKFYNVITGEFYAVDEENGNYEDDFPLLTFSNYPDYVLRDMPEHKDNAKAREFIMTVFNSNLELRERTLWAGWNYDEDENLYPIIGLSYNFTASWEFGSDFNYKYKDRYYAIFHYDFLKDKFVLETQPADYFDEDDWRRDIWEQNGYVKEFDEYMNNYIPGTSIEITFADLKDLHIWKYGTVPLEYMKIFK